MFAPCALFVVSHDKVSESAVNHVQGQTLTDSDVHLDNWG